MTIAAHPISLALAQFEDIVSRGLQSLVDEDPSLTLVAADVPHERLAVTLAEHTPDVAILNFASLTSPAELRDLQIAYPDTRLLVLANAVVVTTVGALSLAFVERPAGLPHAACRKGAGGRISIDSGCHQHRTTRRPRQRGPWRIRGSP